MAFATLTFFAGQAAAGTQYRIYEGLACYVHNPEGRAFTVRLDVRDLNVFSHGARELLFKVYDPDGVPVVREFIPDDGITNALFGDRIAGWDHDLPYYANLYAKGTTPALEWSDSIPACSPDALEQASLAVEQLGRKMPGNGRGPAEFPGWTQGIPAQWLSCLASAYRHRREEQYARAAKAYYEYFIFEGSFLAPYLSLRPSFARRSGLREGGSAMAERGMSRWLPARNASHSDAGGPQRATFAIGPDGKVIS